MAKRGMGLQFNSGQTLVNRLEGLAQAPFVYGDRFEPSPDIRQLQMRSGVERSGVQGYSSEDISNLLDEVRAAGTSSISGMSQRSISNLGERFGVKNWQDVFPDTRQVVGDRATAISRMGDVPAGREDIRGHFTLVEDYPVTEREWVKDMLMAPGAKGYLGSGLKAIGDVFLLLDPWGPATSKEAGSKGSTLFPNIQNLFSLVNEVGVKGENFLNAPEALRFAEAMQGFLNKTRRVKPKKGESKTPGIDSLVDYYMSVYNFENPQVRMAFEKLMLEDPIAVWTDGLAAVSAGGLGVAAGGKTLVGLSKALNATSKARGAIAGIGGTALKVNRALNVGFNIPGTRGLKSKWGITDLLDPSIAPLAAGIELGKFGGIGGLSKFWSRYKKDFDPRVSEVLERQGGDVKPSEILLSMQTRNQRLIMGEAGDLKLGVNAVLEKAVRTADLLDESISKLQDATVQPGLDVRPSVVQIANDITSQYRDFVASYNRGQKTYFDDILKVTGDQPVEMRRTAEVIKEYKGELDSTTLADQVSDLPENARGKFQGLERDLNLLFSKERGAESFDPRIGSLPDLADDAGIPFRVVRTRDGKDLFAVTYDVMSLSSLVSQSRRLDDAELGRAASTLNPRSLLVDSGTLDGAPLVGFNSNNVVGAESAFDILSDVMANHPSRADEYYDLLRIVAGNYGISDAKILGMENPVLVRRLAAGTDPVTFLNMRTGAPVASGHYLSDTLLENMKGTGSLTDIVNSNSEIIKSLSSQMPASVIKGWQTGQTGERFNAEGLVAVADMIKERTFPGQRGREMLMQIKDESLSMAIDEATVPLAKFEAGLRGNPANAGFSISEDIAEAVAFWDRLNKENVSVADFLLGSEAAGARGLSATATELLPVVDAVRGDTSSLARFVDSYVGFVEFSSKAGMSKLDLVRNVGLEFAGDVNAKGLVSNVGDTPFKYESVFAGIQAVSDMLIDGVTRLTPGQRDLFRNIEKAMRTDLFEGLGRNAPEKIDDLVRFHDYMEETMSQIDSSYGRFIVENMDEIVMSGESFVDTSRKLVEGLIRPGAVTPEWIRGLREMLGQEGSKAWDGFQLAFVTNLVEGAWTARGKQVMSEGGKDIAHPTRRHKPLGVTQKINAFRESRGEFSNEVLQEILGTEKYQMLTDIERLFLGLEQFYRVTEGSLTAPWTAILNKYVSREGLARVAGMMVLPLMGVGMGAAMWPASSLIGELFGLGVGGAMTGARRVLMPRLFGKDLMQYVKDHKYLDGVSSEVIRNYLRMRQEEKLVPPSTKRAAVKTSRVQQRAQE